MLWRKSKRCDGCEAIGLAFRLMSGYTADMIDELKTMKLEPWQRDQLQAMLRTYGDKLQGMLDGELR